MRRALAVATVASIALVTLASSGSSSAQATSVDTGDFYFCNSSFENGVCDTTVTQGSTVTWTLSGAAVHTVTQCDASFATCPPAGGFDSGLLSSGESYSFTFNTPGTISYYCTFHPAQMRGRVVVQGVTPTSAAATTPAAPGTTSAPQQTGSASGGGGSAATATPAGVPAGGGEPTGGSRGSVATPIWILGVLSVAAGGAALAALKRRAD
jgi:plastocyanin